MKTILILMLFPLSSFAQTFVGTFITVKGDVKVLRNPEGSSEGPFLSYEGQKYAYDAAKIGKKIRPGEIILSGPDGRAKLAYPNGDHFLVGSGTAMAAPTVSEKSADEKSGSSLKLLYGKMRSLISKTGPRKNLKVVTPAAVAGVRGTDFYTQVHPSRGTQLTVLRGEVQVQSPVQKSAPVKVAAGFTAETTEEKTSPKVVETSKEELVILQTQSNVKMDAKALNKLPEAIRNEVSSLNEKTRDAVLDDIKVENPKLYEQLKGKKDAQDINAAVVARMVKTAPSDKKKKPTLEEIEAMGQDVYEKYFKKGDK